MSELTYQLVRDREGFSAKPYWDVNAWRIGYGSDTVTDEDGTVRKVTKKTRTTREAAERDLARRVPEFQQTGIIAYVGQDAWDALGDGAKAAVTSVAYNYGSLKNLRTLKKAIRSGDEKAVAEAILARADDNKGINRERRQIEAGIVLGHPVPLGKIPKGSAKAPTPLAPTPKLTAARQNGFIVPNPLPAPAPLVPKGTPATKQAGFVAPTAAATRGEMRPSARQPSEAVGMAVARPPSAPLKQIVPATGMNLEQQQLRDTHDRTTGYRDIQEMIRRGTPMPDAPSRTSGMVRTVPQNPGGVAGASMMTHDRPPSMPPPVLDLNMLNPQDVDAGIRKYITESVKVPVTAPKKVGFTAPTESETRSEQAQMRARATAAKAAPPRMPMDKPQFKTITVQRLNPQWVEAQKAQTVRMPIQKPVGMRSAPAIRTQGTGLSAPAASAPIINPGSMGSINGVDMAFMPKAVQQSARWQEAAANNR